MTRSHWWAKYVAIAAVVVAAVILAAAYVAAATNVTVSASAVCVDRDTGRYDVTATAHNTYNQTLHVRVDVPTSPILLTLAPDQSWSFTFQVAQFQAWTVRFSSSDGVLIGQTRYDFTFEGVCGTPPPPPSTTSSTTCTQANPPRADCTPTTSPTTTPGVSSTAAPPPPASAAEPTTGPPDTTPVPARTTVPGAAGHPSTVAQQLPVTGMGENVLIFLIFAGSFAIVFGSILLTTRSRARD